MIYSLRGNVIYTDFKSVVIDVGGVGYCCNTTNKTLAQLQGVSDEVTLYTYLAVREDSVDLYGFYDTLELDFFKKLISVSGIGPKIGLSILSDFTPDQLALLITTGDAKTLSKANGLGPKSAQRLVLELKDKVSGDALNSSNVNINFNVAQSNSTAGEAIEALVSIGFTQQEAAKIVSSLDQTLTVEEMIKLALKASNN